MAGGRDARRGTPKPGAPCGGAAGRAPGGVRRQWASATAAGTLSAYCGASAAEMPKIDTAW